MHLEHCRFSAGRCLDPRQRMAKHSSSAISEQSDCCGREEGERRVSCALSFPLNMHEERKSVVIALLIHSPIFILSTEDNQENWEHFLFSPNKINTRWRRRRTGEGEKGESVNLKEEVCHLPP